MASTTTNFHTTFIHFCPDFLHRTACNWRWPSDVERIHDCIVNYKLLDLQRTTQFKEFIEDFYGSATPSLVLVPVFMPNSTYACSSSSLQSLQKSCAKCQRHLQGLFIMQFAVMASTTTPTFRALFIYC